MSSNIQAFNDLKKRIEQQRLTVRFDDSKVANYLAGKISNGTLDVSQNVSEAVRHAVSDQIDNEVHSIQDSVNELKTADTSLQGHMENLNNINQNIKSSVDENVQAAKTNHVLSAFIIFVLVVIVGFVMWFRGLGSIPFVDSAWRAILTGKGLHNICIAILMIALTYSAPFWLLGHVWRLVSEYCFGVSYADYANEEEWDPSDYPKYLTTKKEDNDYYYGQAHRNWWWYVKLVFWHATLGKYRVVWRKEWQEIAKQTKETHTP